MFSIVLAVQDEPETSTPKDALRLQLALIKEGNAVGLRLTFTERLRELVTQEDVLRAKADLDGVGIDELVESIEVKVLETGGKEAVVTRPGGGTLTRLVLVGGDWLADTIWYR